MSSRPAPPVIPGSNRRRITFADLAAKRERREPIAMVTAYDHPSGQVAEAAGVDLVLVGDSAAMTVLGYESTVPVSVEEMLMLCGAVRRAIRTPMLIADLPFGSYELSDEQAVATAQRFIKEVGADAVKVERAGTTVDRVRAIVASGIPVMGHVGLTPQTAAMIGGYRSQGRTADQALAVLESALALQDAGCFAIVFEAIPSDATAVIMPRMRIPVIGIGAGPTTDGQVLVFHDLLGIYHGRPARFVKQYAQLRSDMVTGVTQYVEDVRSRRYPAPEHVYEMDIVEAARLVEALESDGRRPIGSLSTTPATTPAV